MANGVLEKPKQQQPERKPNPPLGSAEYLDLLTGQKFAEAVWEGSEKYLLDKGWKREGVYWREPVRKPNPVLGQIEVSSEDGKSKEIVQQLTIPALPWLYNLPQALDRQRYLEAEGK